MTVQKIIPLGFVFLLLILISCKEKNEDSELKPFYGEERIIDISLRDSLMSSGTSYLSLYSQVYSLSEHKKHNLTTTVSIRNTSLEDTLYLKKADHYSTEGSLMKKSFLSPWKPSKLY